jgi:hypothetical protein
MRDVGAVADNWGWPQPNLKGGLRPLGLNEGRTARGAARQGRAWPMQRTLPMILGFVLAACSSGTGADVATVGDEVSAAQVATTSSPTTTTTVAVTTTTAVDVEGLALDGCGSLVNSIDKSKALAAYREQLDVADREWDEVLRQMRFVCSESVAEALDETPPSAPVNPETLRAEFLGELGEAGWLTYTDPVIGWSIHYPPDWMTANEEPGENVSLVTPAGGFILISAAQDALDDSGSREYLQLNVDYYVADGLIRPPADDDWFWLDHDFNDERGLLDIEGHEGSWAVDLTTGEAIPAEATAHTWRYAYYNPDARPAYSYVFQTVGIAPELFAHADEIVLSFTPPS